MSEQQWQRMDEDERYHSLLILLDKAVMACKDGYFTKEDILTIQHEFGLYNRITH